MVRRRCALHCLLRRWSVKSHLLGLQRREAVERQADGLRQLPRQQLLLLRQEARLLRARREGAAGAADLHLPARAALRTIGQQRTASGHAQADAGQMQKKGDLGVAGQPSASVQQHGLVCQNVDSTTTCLQVRAQCTTGHAAARRAPAPC